MYAYNIVCILHIIEKNAPKSTTASPRPAFSPAQLLAFFVQLLPRRALLALPALQGQNFYDRLFTPLVSLWYLLFQRLHDDHTLDGALSDARAGGADRINKKLSQNLRSDSTASFSDARQRLPWEFLLQALSLQGRKITALSPTTRLNGLVVTLLDGSTVRLRPHSQVAKEFPAHGNATQRRKGAYWCLMRVLVGFCALSGAAVDCAMGSLHMSEQVLACQMILRSKLNSLFIGDRNFGVFRVVQAARQADQKVLLRMTQRRARKLLGRTLRPGSHAVLWRPTRHDQLEPDCSKDPVEGRLVVARMQRRGFRSQWLYLFTTLPQSADYPIDQLLRLYGLRWHIELNLRYLKAQMDLVQLEAKSADMARKEWLAGLLAYNLIRAAQLCAAVQQGLSPLTLSFSSSRRRLEDWLADWGGTRAQLCAQWIKTLERIAACRLPRRSKSRPNEPRAQRHLRLPYAPLYGSRAVARKNLQKYTSKS